MPSAPDAARRPPSFTAGMTRTTADRALGPGRLPVTIWYPARAPERARREGLMDLSAAFDAEPAEGRFPLVAVSHGGGGGDLNHHDWAEALARAGYVVAAPRHLGDSHDFRMGLGSREQLLERPRQLRAAIAAARTHPVLGRCVDSDRLGAMGFSAGGYTVLTVLGARPDFSRRRRYCREDNEAPVACPASRSPHLPVAAPEDWDGVCERGIRAAVLFAPFALVFDAHALGRITIPVRIYRAEREEVTRNPANADSVAAGLGKRPEVATVPGGHYVFIAPVDEAASAKYPVYYRDEPGVDRRALHARIATELVDFFDRALEPVRGNRQPAE